MDNILVIGATGNVGFPAVEYLAKQENIKTIVGLYNKEEDSQLFKHLNNVEFRSFDFLKSETFTEALKDITKVFFIRPPQLAKPKEDMLPFLKELQQRNIKHVVFLSLIGVDKNPVTPHHKIEKMIEELNLPYTFIRPSFFMQNLNTTHQQDIKMHNDLFIPAGNAKTSFIDTRDVGEVAGHCLLNDKYLNKKLEITGSQALTYNEIATIMSKVLNKNITYSKPGLLKFRKVMLSRNEKKDYVNVMVALYFITQLGNAKKITNTIQEVLNRAPITFEKYVDDYREYFL
ncbi:SDR family oxidoreductase [Erysipelotrichaceae bacterium OttesenSCG-928-M19]|nr:SDR family oxidoreductase [Erysipelotrichaceae bacterium OttesenSCG-928-M19]